MVSMQMSSDEASRFKIEEGLDASPEHAAMRDAILPAATALAEEVAKHYRYWDTRRNEHGERVTPVNKVILVGGNANLRGLSDLIASKVKTEVMLGECWRHVLDFDTTIPPIERRISLQYATAIGLALRAL